MLRVNSHTGTIRITGIITPREVEEFEKCIGDLILKGKERVIIDMRGVKHIHYRVGENITETRERLVSMGGDLKIICTNPYILNILRLSTKEVAIEAYPNVREARKNFL